MLGRLPEASDEAFPEWEANPCGQILIGNRLCLIDSKAVPYLASTIYDIFPDRYIVECRYFRKRSIQFPFTEKEARFFA